MKNHTPQKIVAELDKYIVGQQDAKKAVAIALRNRWRRKQVDPELREEIMPKNILMVGPTGVGKTEISRRLAKLSNAPFVKVEATKFTEVGYVGRDVDSIIRDLADISMKMEKEQHLEKVKVQARESAIKRILDIVVGPTASEETRNAFREKLENGELDDKEIEVDVAEPKPQNTPLDISSGASMGVINLSDMIGKAINTGKKTRKKLNIKDALEALCNEESEAMSDEETLTKNALKTVEEDGIVFIDEVDKIVVRHEGGGGKEVSREGVQRDLLPLLEGTSVQTKHGTVKTDHILFICSGAFHLAKPADLLPELQGRLPIRVELQALTNEDMLRILKEPVASLPIQYSALLETEGVALEFTADGLEKIASLATDVNKKVENIGARRLQTIMEKMLEDVSYKADQMGGAQVKIDEKFVEQNIEDSSLNNLDDLSKFIL